MANWDSFDLMVSGLRERSLSHQKKQHDLNRNHVETTSSDVAVANQGVNTSIPRVIAATPFPSPRFILSPQVPASSTLLLNLLIPPVT
jgi:hypothetical protein